VSDAEMVLGALVALGGAFQVLVRLSASPLE
jgi:hypothetical protein